MSPMEVMIEELQADQRIPRGISFRKGMRFASEGIEPITEGAVDSLDVNSTGFGNNFAQNGTDLNGKEFSMLIPVLDGLRQAHLWWYYQRRTAQLPRTNRLTIRSSHDCCIAPPPIATPGQRTALRACDGEGHRSFDEFIADTSSDTGDDETAGAALHKATPACAGIGFLPFPVFFLTDHQNTSLSPARRCSSAGQGTVQPSPAS